MVVVYSWRCSPAELIDPCAGRLKGTNSTCNGKILLVEEFLNEVGKDGWELVSVATTPTDNFTHLIYLKRPSLVENVRPPLLGP